MKENPTPGVVVEADIVLVKIKILGRDYDVPGDISLLRAFQHLEAIRAYTEFCWNGDCISCKIDYKTPDGKQKREILSCRVPVEAGMEVTKVYSVFLKFD